ncbi:MAG: hypothetical protein AAB425_04450, partial [Bdellovibrionota bacterium]
MTLASVCAETPVPVPVPAPSPISTESRGQLEAVGTFGHDSKPHLDAMAVFESVPHHWGTLQSRLGYRFGIGGGTAYGIHGFFPEFSLGILGGALGWDAYGRITVRSQSSANSTDWQNGPLDRFATLTRAGISTPEREFFGAQEFRCQ